jgi:hypothetical protein
VNEIITGNDCGLDANRESFTAPRIEVAVAKENCLSSGYRSWGTAEASEKSRANDCGCFTTPPSCDHFSSPHFVSSSISQIIFASSHLYVIMIIYALF